MKSRRPSLPAPLAALILAPLTFSLVASAAPRIKKVVNKEVYAATDNNEIPAESQPGFALPVESDPAPASAPAPAAAARKARPIKRAQVAKPAAPVKKASNAFDAVPASQSEAILQRLKIVENLVRNYGRAYDYRAHTLKELQLIQSTLESTAAAQAQAQAPAAAPIPTAPAVVTAPAAAAPTAPAPAAQAQAQANDSIRTGQAAATQDTDDVNLSSLPAPAEFDPNNAEPQDN